MDALRAAYTETDSDSDGDAAQSEPTALPPPPLSLLQPPNSVAGAAFDFPTQIESNHSNRVRSFPHVEGNYALHIYIPIMIPLAARKEISLFLKRIASASNELHAVDVDIPFSNLINDGQKFEKIVLGREFHVSLGRTVPIRVHQRDSMVSMLRQRLLQSQRRYWINFDKWEVFVNDEGTRTFLSLEVIGGGLAEIRKQIECVNEVYRLHNLPEFYKDPRPHISVAWASGDITASLKRAIAEEDIRIQKEGQTRRGRIFSCVFGGISCKIGNKTYELCKPQQEQQ
ncbi:uncharacterized protein LOC127256300 isoform X2 [Andrographis paniculata]|uniref:uncharacterized protein LOC127256300 isoform X2 n=1 Tax=Andrographis paniculata TaxID=175694 RepID=UPI0021E8E608|nr:uncharacterized protein LOC127256300 isoform X2 [Andrographis paniculata]